MLIVKHWTAPEATVAAPSKIPAETKCFAIFAEEVGRYFYFAYPSRERAQAACDNMQPTEATTIAVRERLFANHFHPIPVEVAKALTVHVGQPFPVL